MKRVIELAHINNVMWVAPQLEHRGERSGLDPPGGLGAGWVPVRVSRKSPNPLVHDLVKRKFEVKKGNYRSRTDLARHRD